jgi:hypothetical protein
MSKDWRAWDGTCWGYEGFLVDNYYALLAVLDREAALKRTAHARRSATRSPVRSPRTASAEPPFTAISR